jgi:transcription factor TFIIIB component B''
MASAGTAGTQDNGDGTNERPEIADGENAENGANGANDDDVVDGEDGEVEEENGTNTTRRRKRHRAGTPEGAEEVTIVPAIVTLWELASGNRRTGIKSEREKLMKEIDWDAAKQRRREEEYDMAMNRGRRKSASEDADEGVEQGAENEEDDINEQLERFATQNKKRKGIRIRVVNGEHVIDEQSQKVDRHAIANEDMETLEEVEEDDLTKRFNSHTYIHLKRREPVERLPGKDRWTSDATDKFYDCLSRFGTDFMIISKMFPGRTRRHIKAKFAREERLNAARVKSSLLGLSGQRLKWDFDVFKTESGLEESDFRCPREVDEELRLRREEREKEIEEQRLETEETNRQRRLAGDVSEEEDEEGETDAAGKGAAKGRQKDKQVPNRAASPGEEIIEIIDDEEEDSD